MRGESATGDDYYCEPLPFMRGLLGTLEEQHGRQPELYATDGEPVIDLLNVQVDVSGGVSEALAK